MEVPILPEDGGGQKGRLRRAKVGPPHLLARRAHQPRLQVVWGPWPSSVVPLRVLDPLGTLTHGGRPSKYSAASTRRKTPESEKLPCKKKSVGGNSLPEGEIVAIITVIELDFIGIIIIIISTANTIITAAAPRLRCNI